MFVSSAACYVVWPCAGTDSDMVERSVDVFFWVDVLARNGFSGDESRAKVGLDIRWLLWGGVVVAYLAGDCTMPCGQ